MKGSRGSIEVLSLGLGVLLRKRLSAQPGVPAIRQTLILGGRRWAGVRDQRLG